MAREVLIDICPPDGKVVPLDLPKKNIVPFLELQRGVDVLVEQAPVDEIHGPHLFIGQARTAFVPLLALGNSLEIQTLAAVRLPKINNSDQICPKYM